MTNYFEGIDNENDVKIRYKELAKKYHPALGGCTEIMKTINSQYEKVLTGVYQKDGKSITEIEELLSKSHKLSDKIYEIIRGDYGVLVSGPLAIDDWFLLSQAYAKKYDLDLCDGLIAHHTGSAICLTTKEKSQLWRKELGIDI